VERSPGGSEAVLDVSREMSIAKRMQTREDKELCPLGRCMSGLGCG